MAKKRPVNLNLITFKFPLTALVSIGHRISGVILFIMLPLPIFVLSHLMKTGEQNLNSCCVFSSHFVFLLFIWMLMVACIYHAIAGVRHLLMDMGVGDSFKAANRSAGFVLFLLLLTMVVTGVWLWV